MDNLRFYEMGRSVPTEAQKGFTNGRFSGTDINPMWRIKKLTEMFGPAGIGWYTGEVKERAEVHGDVTMAIVDLNLYVKVDGEWSMPIFGTGGNVLLRKGSPSDEGYKMAYTDALSVACKALGIGADIYFASDKTKYTADDTKGVAEDTKSIRCADCGNVITSWTRGGEVIMDAAEVVRNAQKDYGRPLCLSCIRVMKKQNENAD